MPMKILSVTRLYSRTLEMENREGNKVWIKHEAGMTCELDEEDIKDLHASLMQMQEIVVSEVAQAIKEEKKKIKPPLD